MDFSGANKFTYYSNRQRYLEKTVGLLIFLY